MSLSSGYRKTIILLTALAGLGQVTSACAVAVIGGGAAAGAAASQDRGFQGVMSDTRIRADINHLWFQESENLYVRINLQVQEGRVLLSGRVADPQTRVDAVRLAWQVEGVHEVINEIELDDESTLTDRARDTKIGLELRNKLRFDKDVRSLNYSVEVVNQQIYLIGVAQDQAELDRVMAHAKDVRYARRVVNYVRIKETPAPESQS
jgi:osmotically-inducible protein OsmY